MELNKITDLLIKSTAYGLPRVFQSKRLFFKLFWFTFLLTGIAASIFVTLEAFYSYFEFDTITKIESVYEQPMNFPTITFCPYITKQVLIDTVIFGKKLPEIFDLKHTVSGCSFKLDDKNCISNYLAIFPTPLGECFTFNSGKSTKGQSIPILSSVIGGRDESFILNLNVSLGLYVWIHDPLNPPRFEFYNDHTSDTIFVMSKSLTQIKIQKSVERRLGLPYNPCYKDVNTFPLNKTIIDYIVKSKNRNYRQTDCLELCYDIYYLNKNPCNCTKTSLGKVWNDCFFLFENLNLIGCTYNDKMNFFKESVMEKCMEYCPLECDSVSYSITQDRILVKENDGLQLRVYFSSLKYISINQIPKTTKIDMVSTVGNILTLFINFSFVSLLEIAELFIEIGFMIFEKKKTNVIMIQVFILNQNRLKLKFFNSFFLVYKEKSRYECLIMDLFI
jgi:hypothetical protein